MPIDINMVHLSVRPVKAVTSGRNVYSSLIVKIQRVFKKVDQAVLSFQKRTNLACVSGCGHCCLSPNVEATVLEMMPLADHFIKNNQINEWYQKSFDAKRMGPCIFYKPDQFLADKGRCSIYEFRPTLCRLFGYAATSSKVGKPQFKACSILKSTEVEKVSKIQSRIEEGFLVPVYKDFSQMIYQIDPTLGGRWFSINDAFVKAVEMIGLFSKLNSETPGFAEKVSYRKGVNIMGNPQTNAKAKVGTKTAPAASQVKKQEPQKQTTMKAASHKGSKGCC